MLELHEVNYRYESNGENITYRYDLDISAGEVAGILGPSGSGKSTMLDLIAGFLTPFSGNIVFDGKVITNLPPESRPVSILFQHHNLFEHLSVLQNVLIGIRGEIKGNSDEIELAKDILSQMNILDQKDKKVSDLSGGQQQRVALARVLIRKRPVLLLDEPFTGLDIDTRKKMLQLVRDITKENKHHTVMVTHEKSDCDDIADKVYTMNNGILI